MPRRIALVLEYDGTRYAGFQLQSNASSVQGALEEAIGKLTGASARVMGAGRTDAGVHAAGQVACFDTDSSLAVERFRAGLNHYLLEDIAVHNAYEVAGDFDPRRHAIARTYRYTMLEGVSRSPLRSRFAYQVGRSLDVASMNEAMAGLQGERDFAPFSGNLPSSGRTVRFMYRTQVWRQNGDEVCLEVEANAFLHQQVRRIAGAALGVGLRKMTVEEFAALADSSVHGAAALVLPPHGLCLRRVEYKDFPPATTERTAESAVEMAVQ
jgi:tRNA pseudouridine38-40 synthase